MNKKTFLSLGPLMLLMLCASSMAIAQMLPEADFQKHRHILKKPLLIPTPPKIDAASYVLIDVNSGRILAENNPDLKRAPASLTKMMTLYILSSAIEQGRIHLSDLVTISKKAWQTGGSRMFIKVGSKVSVEQLLKGVIIASGNDACVALAEFLAGNENTFADLMNQQAALLKMKNSHFTDSTGMPHPNHHSTARDLSILGRALIRDFPQDYKWYKEKWFTHNGIKQPNRNRLLWRDPSVDGIKTGHTQEAGYCLVTSANRNGMRLLTVVLGAPSDDKRAQDSQRLLNYGFRFFETQALYKAGETINHLRVWSGQQKTIPVGVKDGLYITFPNGEYKHLQASMALDSNIRAPISKGQRVGEITVKLNNELITTKPVIALSDNPIGSIWTRLKDGAQLTVTNWIWGKSSSEKPQQPKPAVPETSQDEQTPR